MPDGAQMSTPDLSYASEAPSEVSTPGAPAQVAGTIAPAEALPARTRRLPGLLEGRGWTLTCLGLDSVMLGLALAATLVGAAAADIEMPTGPGVWLFPPLVLALMALRGMYRPRIQARMLDDLSRVLSTCSVAAMSIVAVATFTNPAAVHPGLMGRLWVFGVIYVAGGRLVLTLSQRQARAERVVRTRTLIVGAGRVGAQVERRLREHPEFGLDPVGFIDAYPAPDEIVPGRQVPVLGGPDDLAEVVERTGAEHVILAFLSSRGADARMVPIVRQCEDLGLQVSLVPRLFESISVRAELEHLGGMPLFRLYRANPRGWEFAIKYALDRALAALLILILWPVLLACVLAVKTSSRGPVFYRQRRVGRDGVEFDLLKFRSMRTDVEPPTPSNVVPLPLPEDTAPGGVEGVVDRRTGVGRLLRRTSLDELPQLLNVLKGDMSVVGPRPERPEFVALFERDVDRYEDRHRVKAGITGWAQVHGLRGKTSLSDRIEWDNFYIENWSLRLDFKILVMTVAALFHNAE